MSANRSSFLLLAPTKSSVMFSDPGLEEEEKQDM
jgi:hypothetical protein